MILDYTRRGFGTTPLVFIHGLGSARTIWKPLLALLETEFDLVAVDLPGHGTTPFPTGTKMTPRDLAAHVHDTLDSLNIKTAHIIGNSLGGWAGLEFAAAYPDRTLSVIGLAPAGMREHPLQHSDWRLMGTRRLARAVKPFMSSMIRYAPLRAIGFAFNSPIWRTWSLETCLDAGHAMAGATAYKEMLQGTFNVVADCTLKIPASIPTTIIFGDSDNTLPPHTSQSRKYLPPHGQWITWERCGHAIQLDYPARVADLIRQTT